MSNILTGSFAEFDPNEVIKSIDNHLLEIQKIKEKVKNDWMNERRIEGRKVGFLFKKIVEWTTDELEKFWQFGDQDWYLASPKYNLWDYWNEIISRFEKIKLFCQLAIAAGNQTVNLSKEDAVFALGWK